LFNSTLFDPITQASSSMHAGINSNYLLRASAPDLGWKKLGTVMMSDDVSGGEEGVGREFARHY
jgi:hypothetical protein